jgi:hypothetical protein
LRWCEFEAEAAALAAAGRQLFDGPGMVMLGTLRRSGWPRLTPLEFTWYDGDLLIGGMWQSKKLRDLERDPRCVLHSATIDKSGRQGDFKLYARAIDERDPAYRERYAAHVLSQLGARLREPYHLFRLDVVEAALVQFGDGAAALAAQMESAGTARVRLIGAGASHSAFVVVTWKEGRP